MFNSHWLALRWLYAVSISMYVHLENDFEKSKAVITTALQSLLESRLRKMRSHVSINTCSVEEPFSPPCCVPFQYFCVSEIVNSALNVSRTLLYKVDIEIGLRSLNEAGVCFFYIHTL